MVSHLCMDHLPFWCTFAYSFLLWFISEGGFQCFLQGLFNVWMCNNADWLNSQFVFLVIFYRWDWLSLSGGQCHVRKQTGAFNLYLRGHLISYAYTILLLTHFHITVPPPWMQGFTIINATNFGKKRYSWWVIWGRSQGAWIPID